MPDNPSGQLVASTGIGALRSLVTLYRRDQAPSDDLAVAETLVPLATVHADIQPTFASTFYASTQVDTPITHMVNIRWASYPPNIDVVIRTTVYPSPRTELFRVRRTKEVGGRKRFIQMECELERAPPVALETDADRQASLTEPYLFDVVTLTDWDNAQTTWDNAGTVWPK